MSLQGSSYENPQVILNTSESTQASGLDIFPGSYMSRGVGGGKKRNKKMSLRKTKLLQLKKGGECGCKNSFQQMFQNTKGGKKQKTLKKQNKKK
jgi:hypothetical protein